MDRLTKKQRSVNMSRIRSSMTVFEIGVFDELKKAGLRFRTHFSNVPGKPDIAQPLVKRAVFLNSDFWHGWQFPRWRKKFHGDFWVQKIATNRKRDTKTLRLLRKMGWQVIVVWEHQLKKNRPRAIQRAVSFLAKT